MNAGDAFALAMLVGFVFGLLGGVFIGVYIKMPYSDAANLRPKPACRKCERSH